MVLPGGTVMSVYDDEIDSAVGFPICLPVRYGMPGTDVTRPRIAMPGPDKAYGTTRRGARSRTTRRGESRTSTTGQTTRRSQDTTSGGRAT
eukprot:2098646-Rhodomonas_salina.1